MILIYIVVGWSLGLLRAVIVSNLWLWFFVPLGVPAISILHAFGIVILVSLIRGNKKTQGDLDFKDLTNMSLHVIGECLSLWLLGYAIHSLM